MLSLDVGKMCILIILCVPNDLLIALHLSSTFIRHKIIKLCLMT